MVGALEKWRTLIPPLMLGLAAILHQKMERVITNRNELYDLTVTAGINYRAPRL
jgi:hypothetical protein